MRGLLDLLTRLRGRSHLGTAKAPCGSADGSESERRENPHVRRRRARLYVVLALAAICALFLLMALYAVYVEPYWIKYHDVEVGIVNLPDEFDGFTIALVTDIHCGRLFQPERLHSVLDRVLGRRPDIIAVAGDLVQVRAAYEGVFGEIDRVARQIPTYVVPGNHDYWQGIDRYRELVAAGPAIDLTNAHCIIKRGAARLVIAGVDDFTDGEPDIRKALAGAGAENAPVVLVMHNPDFFPEVLAEATGVNLALAGHTHGGQVSLPLLGPPIVPVLHREYAAGLVREGGAQIYVSRGVGMLLRVRFNCRPEVAFIVLRKE